MNCYVFGPLFILLSGSGVLCQSNDLFTVPSDTCAEEKITFTCVVANGSTFWTLDPPGEDRVCSYTANIPGEDRCGPGRRFTSSPTEGSSDVFNSSLSVVLTDDLNGTTVECTDATVVGGVVIGSHNICVVGYVPQQPQFMDCTIVTRAGDGEEEWMVRVEWTEVFDDCNGPVSQYVLCVTPLTSGSGSGSGDCTIIITTDKTWHELTLAANVRYSLSVRGVSCGNISGPESDLGIICVNDGTKNQTEQNADPEFSDTTGLLERISVAHGGFSLECMGNTTTYNYTVSLSILSRFHVPANDPGDLEMKTNDTNVTISVPPEAIAEYIPTVTVNVPGARPVPLSPTPILSELNEMMLETDVASVNINGSCKSIISCLAMDSLQNCTVYCGTSADFDSLNKRNSATGSGGDGLTVRLPPARDGDYHCIVSGAASNGSILFRARTMETKLGCRVALLLRTGRAPDCTGDDDSCVCLLYSDIGPFGMNYSSTSVGSSARIFTNNTHCYNGNDSDMMRLCQDNEEWDGEMVDIDDIARALRFEKLSDFNVGLIAVGIILFFIGLIGGVVLTVLLRWKRKSISSGLKLNRRDIVLIVFGAILCIVGLVGAIIVVVLLYLKIKANWKVVWWYWILVALSSVITLVAIVLWIATGVYICGNDFVRGDFIEDDGRFRLENSGCGKPDANSTKNGLVLACFLFSLTVPIVWFSLVILMKWGVKHPPPPKEDEETDGEYPMAEKETYDVLNHPKPTSPQPLLSDTEPSYGKLHQTEEPGHYGKLDHPHKKKVAVAPAGDSEYGKLDRSKMQEEPGHYGKLDHKTKKTTTLPVDTGSSEYGKLDRSQMEDPLHYGKLDHPGKRVATLPNTGGESYGKLDKTQMQVASGVPGDMYDVVTNEPRHVPSKPRRQHSGH